MRGQTALLLLRKQWLANREGQEIPSQIKNTNFHEKKIHSTDINQVQAFLIFFFFLIFSCSSSIMLCQLQVQRREIHLYIYLLFYKLFNHLGCCRVLSRILCAKQQVIFDYSFRQTSCYQKNQIAASGSITSWQIEGEKCGGSDRFPLLGL